MSAQNEEGDRPEGNPNQNFLETQNITVKGVQPLKSWKRCKTSSWNYKDLKKITKR
jgi:hypothetical protein